MCNGPEPNLRDENGHQFASNQRKDVNKDVLEVLGYRSGRTGLGTRDQWKSTEPVTWLWWPSSSASCSPAGPAGPQPGPESPLKPCWSWRNRVNLISLLPAAVC